MNSYQIAGLPGDGIGPECFDAAIQVLRAVEKTYHLSLEIQPYRPELNIFANMA